MKEVSNRLSFPQMEEEILKFWRSENIFQKCVKLADDIWERKDHISWNHELVGHMKYQYYAPHSQLKEYGLLFLKTFYSFEHICCNIFRYIFPLTFGN